MQRELLACAMLLGAAIPGRASDAGSSPPNAWVEVSDEKGGCKYLSSMWYVPATDEFIMWGAAGAANELAKKYDVETFDLRSNAWQDALPKGKEQSWAGGNFPNWVWYGQTAQGNTANVFKGANDRVVSGFCATNRVDFVETDGIARPTRCCVFHQATYDSKRQRMLYFVGGRTFSYDPMARVWTDLKPAKVPLSCEALVWASLCYDPVNDEALLFGGGMALNTWGGAKTWLYDCAKNEWRRPELKAEPPLRGNSRIVYDSKNKLMVLFGGDDQAKALNDTWVYDATKREWSERKPAAPPPAAFVCATAYLEKHGLVLLCAADGYAKTCSTWTYDAAQNVWTPVKGTLPLPGWLSCDYSAKDDAVVLTATGSICWGAPRKTYVYRFDPATAAEKRAGAAPGTPVYKHEGQRKALLSAPPADRKATEAKLASMPSNQWVDAEPPGAATNKTWSDCTIDTDRGVILYTGGGHSAYSGSDVAHYDVGENRWTLSYDPEFPPFLESTNRTVFGWSANLHPWSEHTRRWYAYDPVSKTMVYARQGGELAGKTLYLGKDGKKEVKTAGADNWIYDPIKKKFFEPTFDRPWGTDDGTCLVTTPKGVYALSHGVLWLCKVTRSGSGEDETCTGTWTKVSDKGPVTGSERDPTLYDSKRNRLVSLISKGGAAEMWFYDLNGSAWTKGEPKGAFQATREACYIPEQDVIFQVTFGEEGKKASVHQVYRCATNEWVQAEIALPTKGRTPASWDTSFAYDPIHKVVVLIHEIGFGAASTTFLLRYDDKSAKVVFP